MTELSPFLEGLLTLLTVSAFVTTIVKGLDEILTTSIPVHLNEYNCYPKIFAQTGLSKQC